MAWTFLLYNYAADNTQMKSRDSRSNMQVADLLLNKSIL